MGGRGKSRLTPRKAPQTQLLSAFSILGAAGSKEGVQSFPPCLAHRQAPKTKHFQMTGRPHLPDLPSVFTTTLQ